MKYLLTMICYRCKHDLPITEFPADSTRPTGLFPWCRRCKAVSDKCNYTKHRTKYLARRRAAYKLDPERVLTRTRKSYLEHIDARHAASLHYRQTHKAEITARAVRYRAAHKQARNAHSRRRRATDICYKLSVYLRSRLGKCLTRQTKAGSAVRDLGCTLLELKLHLERRFTSGMAWGNYGPRGWHIDHIVALASFDLCDPEQFKQAVHYTNLQPLWAKDNYTKEAQRRAQQQET